MKFILHINFSRDTLDEYKRIASNKQKICQYVFNMMVLVGILRSVGMLFSIKIQLNRNVWSFHLLSKAIKRLLHSMVLPSKEFQRAECIDFVLWKDPISGSNEQNIQFTNTHKKEQKVTLKCWKNAPPSENHQKKMHTKMSQFIHASFESPDVTRIVWNFQLAKINSALCIDSVCITKPSIVRDS